MSTLNSCQEEQRKTWIFDVSMNHKPRQARKKSTSCHETSLDIRHNHVLHLNNSMF